jgi:hypothetical protein
MKRYIILLCVCLPVWGGLSCVGTPGIEKPQFTQRHYTFSVLLDPEKPGNSPQLELAMSLLQMEYPEDQAGYLNNLLYSEASLDAYKDKIVSEHRKNYREKASGTDKENNWRYSETVNLKRYPDSGMVIQRAGELNVNTPRSEGIVLERNINSFSGGRQVKSKRYLNLDMNGFKQLRIDDFFANFQTEKRLRDIIYEELRRYSGLERGKELSEGIYFSNEPELSFNFFITDDGLGLHWDPDQIAPPSQGEIEVILPWQIIRPMMLFTGIELLTKFNIHLFV